MIILIMKRRLNAEDVSSPGASAKTATPFSKEVIRISFYCDMYIPIGRRCVESMDGVSVGLSRLRLQIGRKRHLARTFNVVSGEDK
jgi:hypothetical protein